VAQAGELSLTQVGITMGTPLYMSPEQVEGKEVDPRSDIYSLGVTCYHMLAGRPPFDGETALAVAVQHLKQEPTRLEDLLPELSPGLCRIVHRMLAKSPQDRYQKAIDILKDLRTLQIPGLEADWAADLPGWTQTESALHIEGRLAATQQLSRLLRSQHAGPGRTTPAWAALLLLGLIALGLAAGGTAAWISRPGPLLAAPSDPLKIKKLDGVEEQYVFAQMAKDDQEAAYLAVAEYWPPADNSVNQRHAWLAKKGLAFLYLRNDRLDEAGKLYGDLAALDPQEEPILRLAGIAGLAVIYDRLSDQRDDDTALFTCLATLYNKTDEELRQLGDALYTAVTEVLDKHRPAE
jgi:eukaryotic-like serine/threonine-protein kinase